MVCEKCETKLSRLATTTVRKSKLETKPGQSSKKITSENKLLSAQEKFKAKEDFKKCRICNHSTHKMGCHYCATCAYQKGICAMCGRKITKVSLQRQSLE
uniref:Cysteine-rich PDZ-binding protein n=1 Tax=Steinernema glaseri TaxID=37863 RepID=A0A1I8AMZ8_9BILA